MSGGADVVLDQGVRSELRTALSASPLLGRLDQRTADALPPVLRLDVPAFEIRHAIGQAVLGVSADEQFHESHRAIVVVDGDEDGQRHLQSTGQELLDLLRVPAPIFLGPQRLTHAQPGRGVFRRDRANPHVTVCLVLPGARQSA